MTFEGISFTIAILIYSALVTILMIKLKEGE